MSKSCGVLSGDGAWECLQGAIAAKEAIPVYKCSSYANCVAALEAGRMSGKPVAIELDCAGSSALAGASLENDSFQSSILGAAVGVHVLRFLSPAYGVKVLCHTSCKEGEQEWLDSLLDADTSFAQCNGEPLFSSHSAPGLEKADKFAQKVRELGIPTMAEGTISAGSQLRLFPTWVYKPQPLPSGLLSVQLGGLPDHLPLDILAELQATAMKLCAPGKGFLAADESAGPWLRAGHAEAKKIPDTIENRAAYRSMCFSTPGLSDFISGVILHWETLMQKDATGKAMVDIITGNGGMIPGIKLDMAYNKKGIWGTEVGPLGHPEVSTKGLDDLQERCQQAYRQGARFAKWRNVLQLDPEKGLPSDLAIADTVHTLARYASICQSERLVPIVEPEIVPNGTHDIRYCAKVTEKVLIAQFKALAEHHVYLPGCLLKPNMVKPGIGGPKASHELIAQLTVETLLRNVPPSLPGIFFLSGETALDEDNEEVATINLSNMNKLGKAKMPWHLSFSYGKALQKTCIVTWMGRQDNVESAQKALKARAHANYDAVMGKYVPGSCPSVGIDGNVTQAAGPY